MTMKSLSPSPRHHRSSTPRFGFYELGALILTSLCMGYSFTAWNYPASKTLQRPLDASDLLVLRSSQQQQQQTQHHHVSMVTNTATTIMTTSSSSSSSTSSTAPTTPSSSSSSNMSTLDDSSILQVAWLMSYPNSGTSYTVQLVRHLSLTHTGTNYGDEILGHLHNTSVPIFFANDGRENGPFYSDPGVHPEYEPPRQYILTKTHCGGRCVRCGPIEYLETTYSFRHRCLSGNRAYMTTTTKDSGTAEQEQQQHTVHRIPTTYAPTRVRKAVHLIRDPFDNVVSRFHLERKSGGGEVGRVFAKDRTGFRNFCQYLNKEYREVESRSVFLDTAVDQLTAGVPCRSEFFRFVEWHNLAMVTTRDLGLDTYYLYYDWYSSRFDQTVDELFAFLELPKRGWTKPFEDGKFYRDFYTEDERTRMIQAMKVMASPPLWTHLEHFFS